MKRAFESSTSIEGNVQSLAIRVLCKRVPYFVQLVSTGSDFYSISLVDVDTPRGSGKLACYLDVSAMNLNHLQLKTILTTFRQTNRRPVDTALELAVCVSVCGWLSALKTDRFDSMPTEITTAVHDLDDTLRWCDQYLELYRDHLVYRDRINTLEEELEGLKEKTEK